MEFVAQHPPFLYALIYSMHFLVVASTTLLGVPKMAEDNELMNPIPLGP